MSVKPADGETVRGDESLRTVQRRVIRSLLLVQAVFSLMFAMAGPLISLIAERLTGSAGKAGLAQAMIYCGAVLFSVPLASLSMDRGRRTGIAAGYLTGAAGAAAVVLGAVFSTYVLLLVGAVALGAALAAGAQARYAATDLASADRLGRSMGVLSWSSIAAAVLGPALTGAFAGIGRGVLPEFSGPYVAIAAGLAISGMLVFVTLRPDPLLLARSLDRETKARPKFRTALAAVAGDPPVRRAVLSLMIVHATMISLMNMASIHLDHGAATLATIGVVISVHTAAMFLPGPLVGYLSDRIGAHRMLLIGLALEVAAAITLAATPAHDPFLVGLGLLLLGAGWSAGYLSGSVLLTASTRSGIRTLVQGAADFLVLLTSAGGALLAGVMVALWGYGGLSLFWGAVVAIVFVRIATAARRTSPE
ncbi:Putative membrane protein [Amycolatopsis japonica]|uniref:Putative membrane protein n=1 Tax=Amycolatopsis japonica TaxID=208439 RepID=A0A075V7D1_9PSEU|nr:MFS transporter [Amycolatopsis japonica]AIG80379.1 Putative membrane protein [Amycolatopsis japonica]